MDDHKEIWQALGELTKNAAVRDEQDKERGRQIDELVALLKEKEGYAVRLDRLEGFKRNLVIILVSLGFPMLIAQIFFIAGVLTHRISITF